MSDDSPGAIVPDNRAICGEKDLATKIQRYVSDNSTGLKAGLALIPYVGGAIGNLVFGKLDEVRKKNVDMVLKTIAEEVHHLGRNKLSVEWFDTAEALNVLRTLTEAIQCEHEEAKVRELARIFPICGTIPRSGDPLKISVMGHLAQMTAVSIMLLRVLSKIAPQQQTFQGSGLRQTMIAIWPQQVVDALKANPAGRFWTGTMLVDIELELLVANASGDTTLSAG